MIHFSDMTLAQTLLIEIGVLLQLIAVGTFMKDRPHYGHTTSSKEEARHLDEHEDEPIFDLPAAAPSSGALRPGMTPQARPTGMKAASLTSTAKVRFVQSFKFRS